MKRVSGLVIAVFLLLSLTACGIAGGLPEESLPAPTLLAQEYVRILQSGTYQYSYIVPYEDVEMTITQAAADGNSVYQVALDGSSSRILQTGGQYYAVDDKTGTSTPMSAEKDLGGVLDFSIMSLVSSEKKDGKVIETYSMRRNGQAQEVSFVFEQNTLIALAFSYMEDDTPYYVMTEFSGDADEALFALPDKTALAEGESEPTGQPETASVVGEWLLAEAFSDGSLYHWSIREDGTYTLSLVCYNSVNVGTTENWGDGNWVTEDAITGRYSVNGNEMTLCNDGEQNPYFLTIELEGDMLYTMDDEQMPADFQRIVPGA